jgi:hypothetical protein
MKALSYKVLLWIINLSLFIYIIGGVIILSFYLSGKIDSTHFLLGLDTRRNYPLSQHFSTISSDDSSIVEPSLVATDLAISFNTKSPVLQSLFLGMTIFQILYTGLIIITLRRIVKSLQIKNPFSTKTIRELRLVGILLLLIEPLHWIGDFVKYYVIDNFFTHSIPDSGGFVYSAGYWIGLNFGQGSLASSWVAAGLIVLILVEVFKQGLQIKEEQDLTI